MFYNREGKQITSEEFEKLFTDDKYKIIKQEDVGKYFISTVWLGVNYNFGEGELLIFETVVFEGRDLGADLEMERYSTEKEAIKGHKKMVNRFKKLNK
ncbi:MAG: hypothetical protein GY849_17955 [Deltaproteobacteria bacterium]|nr:hypothetical protein [Deltaproteobacteria bacterium]